jgi:hypothetical protein
VSHNSDSCKYCDKFYTQLISAVTETGGHELHHRTAESAFNNLKKGSETAEINPNLVVLFVDLCQVLFCRTHTLKCFIGGSVLYKILLCFHRD